MTKRFSVFILLFAGMLFFHLSYATAGRTKLTSSKFDSSYKGGHLKSVMIVAMAKKTGNRKIFEDTFVKEFQSHDVKAVSSMGVVPQGKESDKNILKAEAEKLGIEHLLVIQLVDIKEKKEEISIPLSGPGITLPSHRYNMPTLGIKETRVKLESRLYEFKTEKRIWSAASESVDPKSTKEIVEQLSGKVMKSLKKSNLLE
ncbi:hypothetical protein ACFL9T_12830 [Thermodesulfobacteriota bacterium]